MNTGYKPTLMSIADMKKPVISAVNGAAAGVGSAFVMTCDLTIMADNAYVLQAFSNIGLIPDGGATWLLSNTIGYKRAYQLAVEAERIPAEICLEMGLANKVVPADALMDEAWAWAEKIASRPPLSLKYTKKAMRQASQISLADAISLEASFQQVCSNSQDAREGVQAFFEKRPANFTGR
ncbi:MAG: enoyl-CoA hydratase-related protein [Pseudomonadota bacterium]